MWGTAVKKSILPLRKFKKRKHSLKKFSLVPQTCETSAIWFISAESASSFWEFTACMWQRTNAQMKHKSIAGSLSLSKCCFALPLLKIHHETQINLFWQQTLLLSEPHVLSGECMKISSLYPALFISVKMDHSVLGGGFSRTYDPHFFAVFKCHVHTRNLLHSVFHNLIIQISAAVQRACAIFIVSMQPMVGW